jgi:hypothetical protein
MMEKMAAMLRRAAPSSHHHHQEILQDAFWPWCLFKDGFIPVGDRNEGLLLATVGLGGRLCDGA